jgi:two-component system sensor histidine kinase AlgZ
MSILKKLALKQGSNLDNSEFWLPDFCSRTFTLRIGVICVFISLFLLLAQSPYLWPFPLWDYLLLMLLTSGVMGISFFLICRWRQQMMRWRQLAVAVAVIVIIMVNVLWLSLAGFMLLDALGLPMLSFVSNEYSAILRHLLISGLFAGLFMRYLALQAQLRNREKAALESRLEALQARIEPHFLFNSMNIIASLISIDPEKAEQVVVDLAALFRASLKDTADVSLAEEIELCRRYANIEELRLGDRLNIDWHVPAEVSAVRIPLLTLQPLLENAIRHGAEMSASPCKITLVVQISPDWVRIRLTNPLSQSPSRPGNRMSMRNVRLRLQARFGPEADLEAAPEAGFYVTELSYPRRLA